MDKKGLREPSFTLFGDSQSGIVKVILVSTTNIAFGFILKFLDEIIVFISLDLDVADKGWDSVNKISGHISDGLQPIVEGID